MSHSFRPLLALYTSSTGSPMNPATNAATVRSQSFPLSLDRFPRRERVSLSGGVT